MGRTLLLTVALLVSGAVNVAGQTSGVRGSVPLPTTARALAEMMGLENAPPRARLLLDIIRLMHGAPFGESAAIDPARRKLQHYLETHPRNQPATAGTETVPLPLSADVWRKVILREPIRDEDLVVVILSDRDAALLYYGLAAMDDSTLALLAADHNLLTAIHRRHAAVFAAFGGSFRVQQGQIQLPGGPESAPVWEALVEERVARPAAFFGNLLSRNGGRLAFFYDTMANLDPPRQRFALGAGIDPAERLKRAATLYRAFVETERNWRPDIRPFWRPRLDGAILLAAVTIDDMGGFVGPTSRALWGQVFRGKERDDGRSMEVDAAWLASRILLETPIIARERLDVLLFAQRVFPNQCRSGSKPCPDELAAVLQGFLRAPALMLTLERMGVRDLATYVAANRLVESLSTIGDRASATVAIAQFQSAVAILDRVARWHVVADADVFALLGSLLALQPSRDGYEGRIARWVDEALLPALPMPRFNEELPSTSPAAEARLISALAAAAAREEKRERIVEWEGDRYAFDLGAPELSRLARVRRRQAGHDLDQALRVCRAIAEAAAEGTNGREQLSANVSAAVEDLPQIEPSPRYAFATMPLPQKAAETSLKRLASAGGSASDRRKAAAPLVAASDTALANVLMSVTYALYLGEHDGPVLLAGNSALNHDFGDPHAVIDEGQALRVWQVPDEKYIGGWRVSGSLLALDVALARFSLRRLAADELPPRPMVNSNETRTFNETVAFMTPFELTDADADEMVAAVARGRARLAAIGNAPTAAVVDEIARDAGLSGWRREALHWSAAHDERSVDALFSLAELMWLGRPNPKANLAAWGMSSRALTGCLCTAFPPPLPWERMTGRPALGVLATQMPDLTIRLAMAIRERGLPAALVRDALSVAMRDFLDGVRPAHDDDWPGLVSHVRNLSQDRIDDYLSSLAAGGPLVPVPPMAPSGGAR